MLKSAQLSMRKPTILACSACDGGTRVSPTGAENRCAGGGSCRRALSSAVKKAAKYGSTRAVYCRSKRELCTCTSTSTCRNWLRIRQQESEAQFLLANSNPCGGHASILNLGRSYSQDPERCKSRSAACYSIYFASRYQGTEHGVR